MAASEVGAGVGASVGAGVGAAAVGAAVGTGPLVAMAVAPCPGGPGVVGPDASELGLGVGASIAADVGAAAVGPAVGTGPLVAIAVAPWPGGAGIVGPDAACPPGVNATACIRWVTHRLRTARSLRAMPFARSINDNACAAGRHMEPGRSSLSIRVNNLRAQHNNAIILQSIP